MPFGTLDAEFIEVKAKKPKQSKPEIRKPEIKTIENKKTEVKKHEPPHVPEIIKTASDTIEVAVLCRNASAALDLITGLYYNSSSILSATGLALYSDNRTLSVLQANKRKLSGLFRTGEAVYIQPASAEGLPAGMTLTLSPSGMQKRGIKVNFSILDMNAGFGGFESCDTIWAMSDAPIYEENDSYSAALASALSGAASSGKLIFLLMTEFEKYGKVSNIGGIYKAERRVLQKLSPAVKVLSADSMILPVQLYGGLAYIRLDGDSLVFGENEYGGMLAYKPEGCHIPLLFSIEALNESADKMFDQEIIKIVQNMNRPQRAALLSENN